MCAIYWRKLLPKPPEMWIYTHFLSLCSMLSIVFLSNTFLKSIHNCIPFPPILKYEPTFSSTQLGQQQGKGKRKKRKENVCVCVCVSPSVHTQICDEVGTMIIWPVRSCLGRKYSHMDPVRTQCLHDVRGHSTSPNLIPNGRDMSFCKVIPLRKEQKRKNPAFLYSSLAFFVY